MTTNVKVTISAAARLEEGASLEEHLRQRCIVLRQYTFDLEAQVEDLKQLQVKLEEGHAKALDEKEAELSAKIAGLEDELRVARSASVVAEEPTDGEQ